MLFTDECLNEW